MDKNTYNFFKQKFGINHKVLDFSASVLDDIGGRLLATDDVAQLNQLKVLSAMQKNKLGEAHFFPSNGYGYNDAGRDTLELIFADVFGTEAGLVRSQFVSGTHALAVALFGNLHHGDELLYATGKPYDTLEAVIGIRSAVGSLAEQGVTYRQADLTPEGEADFDAIRQLISPKTKIVALQRSKGYTWRKSFTPAELGKIIKFVKSIDEKIICLVDNCYGEFVCSDEPSDYGADLVVGSLIKNPGGGLAPSGGYIVGKDELVNNASYRLTAPGLGKEVGASLGNTALFLEGLFLAPQAVNSSVKSAIFASAAFKALGFDVLPEPDGVRTDIVQAIKLLSRERVIAFCEGIQSAAPVNSFVSPEPSEMAGYESDIIMAAGAFVQGASIELSADAPMREPYSVFLQGGLTWFHAKAGVIIAIDNLYRKGLIQI